MASFTNDSPKVADRRKIAMPEISSYQTESGTTEVRLDQDTVWISQEQMAALFGVQKALISKHLKNISTRGELERTATISKVETVQREGRP